MAVYLALLSKLTLECMSIKRIMHRHYHLHSPSAASITSAFSTLADFNTTTSPIPWDNHAIMPSSSLAMMLSVTRGRIVGRVCQQMLMIVDTSLYQFNTFLIIMLHGQQPQTTTMYIQ